MSDTTDRLDLSSLEKDYDIVGQLGESDEERILLATRKGEASKRRDDQREVVIRVVSTPPRDEAHALSHLAADTQLLARTRHRRLVPVLEGRWIGNDAFAVVTQRITDPSIAQLVETGETFTNPRIAAILRDVNGLLEWARETKIVHRNVTPATVFLEPGTDRVRVTFGIAPLQRLRQSDADDDAKTIVRLALTMLLGELDPEALDPERLTEERPDLPSRLAFTTASLLHERKTDTPVDVAAFLALIGMADPVREGESERERIREEILEEQRLERERIATDRAEFERLMEAERAAFTQQMATERANFERLMQTEHEKLERERAALERSATEERTALQRSLADERAALVARQAELERTVAEQRAELERAATRDRQQIEALRAEIRRAGELEVEKKRQAALDEITDMDDRLDEGSLATPPFIAPDLAPFKPLTFDNDIRLMRTDRIKFDTPPEVLEPRVEPVAGDGTRLPSRRQWIWGGVAAALLVMIGASALIRENRSEVIPPTATTKPVSEFVASPVRQAPAFAVPLPAAVRTLDSAAGSVAPRMSDDTAYVNAQRRAALNRVRSSVARTQTATTDSISATSTDPRPLRATARDTTVRRPAVDEQLFIPGSATPIPVRVPPDTTRPQPPPR